MARGGRCSVTMACSRRANRPKRWPCAETITGTLVSTQGGITLRAPDGSVRILNGHSGVKLPSLPGGLISKPTLVWDIEAATLVQIKDGVAAGDTVVRHNLGLLADGALARVAAAGAADPR